MTGKVSEPDRYDRVVLEMLSREDEPVRTRTLMRFYRQAGVRNRRKAKARIKALEVDGLIENAGPWLWAYAGTRQGALA